MIISAPCFPDKQKEILRVRDVGGFQSRCYRASMVAAVSRQNLDVALFVNYSHETFPRISAINAILRRIKYEK